ncbi:hypothetical protein B0T17DRAFT_592610 [Bombardia bombarda]|uniref:DSC E3 ubiquitin ligase complex subunit A n=1 Tax=Bombardia bombarda TaxID=252184 RepID=A0AA39WID1_9PEZI|nr:hypothetical protein B0T17DRAFT_592610 [Bombardia bombarda]
MLVLVVLVVVVVVVLALPPLPLRANALILRGKAAKAGGAVVVAEAEAAVEAIEAVLSAAKRRLTFVWLFLFESAFDAILMSRQAHGILNSTVWGDFSPRPADDSNKEEPKEDPKKEPEGNDAAMGRYLNMTGFREQDGYAWDGLALFQDRCHEATRNVFATGTAKDDDWDHGPADTTWQNVTGTVHGEWARKPGASVRQAVGYNLTSIAPGFMWPGPHQEWARNITGAYGNILLRLEEDSNGAVYEEKTEGSATTTVSRKVSLVREASAVVTIQDEANSAISWNMRLHGVHWPRQGALLLSTTSDKFAGIFGLPHLAPGADYFNSSQKLLGKSVGEVLDQVENSRFADPNSPWASNVEGVEDPWAMTPQCEYIMYLQLHPIDHRSAGARPGKAGFIADLENELRYPTGAPIKRIPDLRMSLVAWSPDCSFYLESKGPPRYPSADGQHLVGMKQGVFLYRTKLWLLGFAAIVMGQVWLLKAQMKESSTPSTIGRVSFYTAGVMLLADGLAFAGASAWSLSATNTFLPCLMVTFAAFMSMILGGSFLSDVYRVQEPEWRNRDREREQRNAASSTTPSPPPPAPAPHAPQPNTLPLPVTARTPPRPPSPPIIIPSDQDIDAEIAENLAAGATAVPTPAATTRQEPPRATTFASITGRFIILGTLILFLSAAASSWPPTIRSIYINSLAFFYLSLWAPQIWRNVQRNSRRAFAWRFMIGQSVLRLLPLAYFYLRRDNVLFADPDGRAFAVLAGWVWTQLWVLAFQDVLGPRFGIPVGWAPEAWDYHPVLREDNEDGDGLGRTRSWSVGSGGGNVGRRERDKDRERRGMHTRSMDCAICRELLEVPVVRAGASSAQEGGGGSASAGGVAGVLARRAYMVTPCRHIFHTKCLEGWLRFRLQCPICREELPPL